MGSPPSQVQWRAPTSYRSSRRARLPSPAVPSLRLLFRSLTREARRVRAGVIQPDSPTGSTDGRSGTAFRSSNNVGPHDVVRFRSSIAQPACSLCTLRGRGCPRAARNTRYRPIASLCRAGFSTRWVQKKVSARHCASPFSRLRLAHCYSNPHHHDARPLLRHGECPAMHKMLAHKGRPSNGACASSTCRRRLRDENDGRISTTNVATRSPIIARMPSCPAIFFR